tara:strand:- start:6321 stop:6704 length:384 start_codon:yes stop_codon:yes gene_type:complete
MSNPDQFRRMAEVAHLCEEFLSLENIPYAGGHAIDDLYGFVDMLLQSVNTDLDSDYHMLNMIYDTPKGEKRSLNNFISQVLVLFICLPVSTKKDLGSLINRIVSSHILISEQGDKYERNQKRWEENN